MIIFVKWPSIIHLSAYRQNQGPDTSHYSIGTYEVKTTQILNKTGVQHSMVYLQNFTMLQLNM